LLEGKPKSFQGLIVSKLLSHTCSVAASICPLALSVLYANITGFIKNGQCPSAHESVASSVVAAVSADVQLGRSDASKPSFHTVAHAKAKHGVAYCVSTPRNGSMM
jgi:hypothetical protein